VAVNLQVDATQADRAARANVLLLSQAGLAR
jgi:hypothetical protein